MCHKNLRDFSVGCWQYGMHETLTRSVDLKVSLNSCNELDNGEHGLRKTCNLSFGCIPSYSAITEKINKTGEKGY